MSPASPNDQSLTVLLDDLRRAGIELHAEDGRLRFRAPRGALTPELRERLTVHRDEILERLQRKDRPLLKAHPEDAEAPFPLTDIQTSHLVGRGSAIDYGGLGCHGYTEIEFPDLDPVRLEDAWNRLVERHGMLRAGFDVAGWQQVPATRERVGIGVTDVRGQGIEAAQTVLDTTRERMAHQVYDIESWPLFELHVTRHDCGARLHFSIDLLIADARSITTLIDELVSLYLAPHEDLKPLDATFRDYVLALRAIQEPGHPWAERVAQDRDYWQERLNDLPGAPEVPLAPSRQSPPTFHRHVLRLDANRWKALKTFAASAGASPTGLLLAVYGSTLARWARRPRFTLNVTSLVPLPLHDDLERIIGDFTSTIPVLVDASGADRIEEVIGRVHHQLWEDLDHHHVSGVEVVREIARRRGWKAALLPFVFTSMLGVGSRDSLSRLGGRTVQGLTQTPQVLIDCQVLELDGELEVSWDVRDEALRGDWDKDAFTCMRDLLLALADGRPIPMEPDPTICRITPVLGRPIRLERSVVDRALTAPDSVAVISGERSWTYKNLLDRSAAYAASIRAAGAAPGNHVAVCLPHGFELVSALVGALRAGTAYVPIDVSHPVGRRVRIAELAEASLVITDRDHTAEDWRCTVLNAESVTDSLIADTAGIDEETDTSAPAYLIYTSGSTGAPKGVVITHAAADNTIMDVSTRFGVDEHDRAMALASPSFDLSVYDVFGVLAAGGALIIPTEQQRTDPVAWAGLVRHHKITIWNSVPAQMQMVLDSLAGGDNDLASLRTVLLSGDWIPVALPGRLRTAAPSARIISLGGATEASIWSVFHEIDEVAPTWVSIPYGRALTNQAIHVLDEDLRERRPGVDGELYLAGAGLARGYHASPEITARQFLIHPRTNERLYRTGDWGRRDTEGIVEFLGREDGQVKVHGHRIELAEVESALASHPSVSSAVALVDRSGDSQRLVGFVAPAPATDVPVAAGLASSPILDDVDNAELAQVAILGSRRALHSMARVLWDGGLDSGPRTHEELLALATPSHHGLLTRWIRALVHEGLLVESEGTYCMHAEPTYQEAEALDVRIREMEDHTGYGHEVDAYIRNCMAALPSLLRGDARATELLFPEGKADVALGAYRDNLVSRYFNDIIARTISSLAEDRPTGSPLRILEVGAGVGGTSTAVLELLEGTDTQYLFTDVSTFFLTRAREIYGPRPGLTYGILDINHDPLEQGIAPNSCDVVLAANVLHNALDIDTALERIHGMLAPRGRLVLLDEAQDNYTLMVSMDFQSGLRQEFVDFRQDTGEVFIPASTWRELLERHGFILEGFTPGDDDDLASVGQVLALARVKDGLAPVSSEELTKYLEDKLPPYMVPAELRVLDTLPTTSNGKTDRKALGEQLRVVTHAVNASGDEEATGTEQAVAAIWQEILGTGPLSPSQNFFNVGGDSLLVARMVNELRHRGLVPDSVTWDDVMRRVMTDPTVRGVAALVDALAIDGTDKANGATSSGAIVLRPGAGRTARVIVHDGSGTLTPYRNLINELRTAESPLPLIGLEASDPQFLTTLEPEEVLDHLCDEHIRTLRTLDLEEVRLTGYCMGGMVAAELARRLPEAGIRVNGLTVISSYRLPCDVTSRFVVEYVYARSVGIDPTVLGFAKPEVMGELLQAALQRTPGTISDESIAAAADESGLTDLSTLLRMEPDARLKNLVTAVGPSFDASYIRNTFEMFRQAMRVMGRVEPTVCETDLTFLSEHGEQALLPGLDDDMESFWDSRSNARFRTVDIPGNHFSCMEPPIVSRIAAELLEDDLR